MTAAAGRSAEGQLWPEGTCSRQSWSAAVGGELCARQSEHCAYSKDDYSAVYAVVMSANRGWELCTNMEQ